MNELAAYETCIDRAADYWHSKLALTDADICTIVGIVGEKLRRIGTAPSNGITAPDIAVMQAIEPVYRLYGLLQKRTGLRLKRD